MKLPTGNVIRYVEADGWEIEPEKLTDVCFDVHGLVVPFVSLHDCLGVEHAPDDRTEELEE